MLHNVILIALLDASACVADYYYLMSYFFCLFYRAFKVLTSEDLSARKEYRGLHQHTNLFAKA